MKYLLLQQRSAEGVDKTWTLKSHSKQFTFGSSKHAEIQSFASGIHGIQGLFHYEKNQWFYTNLQLSSENMDVPVRVTIDKQTDLKVGPSVLTIVPFETPKALFSNEAALTSNTQNGDAKQLFQVYCGKMLLETQLIELGEEFVSQFDLEHKPFATQKSLEWVTQNINHLIIKQRTVHLADARGMASIKAHQLFDKDSKIPMFMTLALAGLLALVFLLSPASKNAGEVAKNVLPPSEYREIKLAPPKKKKIAASAVAQNSAPAPAAANSNASAMDKIKSIAGTSRLSQLLGKISATSARTSNVIVANGTVAGSASSGRALASIGSTDQAGKDWSKEGKATGAGVSTAGVAGGKGVGGMGKLATGKTGTGGAELLDDESEVVGGLDRDIIAQYIHSQLGQILYCYERQLSASPDLFGKVAVKFTIGPKGDIEMQRIQDSTLRNASVEGCILQRVAKWKFPEPQGGTKVNVTYPFLFKSTN